MGDDQAAAGIGISLSLAAMAGYHVVNRSRSVPSRVRVRVCRSRWAPTFDHLSLSRLNHWLPRGQAHPKVMQGTADFHHPIADALLPQADPVFDDAAALDTTVDMLDAQAAGHRQLVGRETRAGRAG